MKSLHLITSKDPLKTQFGVLVSQNGFVYATNGAALIKMPNELVFGAGVVQDEETLIFDANLWSVLKFHTAKIISRKGLDFLNVSAGTTITAKLESEVDFKILQYESVITKPETKPIEISYIGLNPLLLADIAKAYGTKANAFTLQFYGVDKTMELLHIDFPETKAFLFPCFGADKVAGYKEPYRHIPANATIGAVESKVAESKAVAKKEVSNPDSLTSDNVIDTLVKLFEKHIDTRKAILDDYALGDEDCRMELDVADENLRDEISEIELEDSFSDLLEKLKAHEDFSVSDLLDLVEKEEGEVALRDRLEGRGYAYIEVDNVLQQNKLRDFVEAEIWPLYADRNKWSI